MTDELGVALAALPLVVEDATVCCIPVEVASYPDGPRPSSVVTVAGAGAVGHGEHVGWTNAEHAAFGRAVARVLRARTTVGAFVSELVDLPPYDRAALEAAAIDLALRQQGTNLLAFAGVTAQPVRYVVSFARVTDPLAEAARFAAVELKIDVDPTWSDDVLRGLAALGRVAVLDFKQSGAPADHERAHHLMPAALLEDPCPGTAPWSASLVRRLAVDAPIVSTAALDALPLRPAAVNIKPARMGGVLEAIRCLARCAALGIPTYLGGMFEVGVGRAQLRVLAAIACPDGPNDLAPLLDAGPRPARLAVNADALGFG